MSESLRDRVILALCIDHGHLNRQGNLTCSTCNRRADHVMKVLEAEVDRLRADLATARQRIITAIGRLSEDDDEQLAVIAILSGYQSDEAALAAGGGGPTEGDKP